MSAPVRMPRTQRRASLLDAAREVFVESGFHAAAMDDIAERAGVSKPVLYQHFPGKLELYLALLDQALEALHAAVEAAVGSTSDNKTRVRQTIDGYFAFVDDPDGWARLIFRNDLTNEPTVRRRLAKAHHEIAGRIASIIAGDTGLPQAQAVLLGSGMAGMAEVAARTWLDGTGVSREEAVDLFSNLAWRGIRGFPLHQPPAD